MSFRWSPVGADVLRVGDADAAAEEHWPAVALAAGLEAHEAFHFEPGEVAEADFGIDVNRPERFAVEELGSGVDEAVAQERQVLVLHREAGGGAMAAVADEQVASPCGWRRRCRTRGCCGQLARLSAASW